jgi:hypothetical protein
MAEGRRGPNRVRQGVPSAPPRERCALNFEKNHRRRLAGGF